MADTLYKRIGGKAALRKAVNLFYIKVLADPRIADLFENIDMEGLIQHQYTFLMKATGGSDVYKGRSLRDAHKGLALNDTHFDAVAENLSATLHTLNIEASLIEEVIALVETTRTEILNR